MMVFKKFITLLFLLITFFFINYGNNNNKFVVVDATLQADIYTKGLANDAADNTTIWFGGQIYMHDLFFQLTIAYPTKKNSRFFKWTDNASIYLEDSFRSMNPAMCRLANYLNECFHDFEGLNNFPGGTDNLRPYIMDFAVTDKVDAESKFTLYSDLQHLPALGVSIVLVHSIPGFNANNGDPLILSRTTMARIFRGNITSWSDPAILATNPNHVADLVAAGNIKLVVRENTTSITKLVKKAFGSFETDFKTQIGSSSDSTWKGVPPSMIAYRPAQSGTTAYIKLESNAMGYVTLSEALKNGLEYAAILPRTYTSLSQAILPNATTTEAALAEKGLDFGNDATNPSRMSVDLIDPINSRAWPIVNYLYFGVRSNTLRSGADCSTRQEVFDFITWFYTAEVPNNILRKFGFSPAPNRVKSISLEKLQKSFSCNSNLIYDPFYQKSVVKINGLEELSDTYQVLQESYFRVKESVLLNFDTNQDKLDQQIAVTDVSQTTPYIGFVHKSDSLSMAALASNKNLQGYPYAGIGVGIIYNFCGPVGRKNCTVGNIEANLDLATIGGIFNGEITYWDDAKIMQHNQGVAIPHIQINVIKPDQSSYKSLFEDAIKSVNPSFQITTSSITVPKDKDIVPKVLEVIGSVSFVPMYGAFDELAKRALIKNKHGNYVAPTPNNIQACGKDTFNISTGIFDLVSSTDPDCYPISEEVYLVSPRQYQTCSESVKTTVSFLQWVVDGDGTSVHAHDTVHYPTLIQDDEDDIVVNVGLGLINNNIAPLFSAYVNPINSKYRKDGTSAKLNVVSKLESITCGGEQMMLKHADLRLIPNELVIAIYSIASVALFIIVSLALWTFINRKKKLVRNSSPTFMYQILLGAAVSITAIYPMGIQDSFYSFHDPEVNKQTKPLDMACQAMPFLYSVGFSISFSSLFVKKWRMVKMFNNRKFRRLKITDWMLLKYQVAIVLSVIIFNIIWIALDPLRWQRIGLTMNDSGQYIISTGLCVMNTDVYYALGPLMGFMILLLVVGNYLSYQARNIPSEYAESKWIGFSMLLYLEALVLGVPVIILSTDNAASSFIVKSVAILLADFGSVLLIFIPKIWLLYGWGIDGQSSMNKEGSGTDSSSKVSAKKPAAKNSRENVISSHVPGSVMSGVTNLDAKLMTANINSQGSLTDLAGTPYGVSMKAATTTTTMDVKVKTQKPKSNDIDVPVEINSKVYSSISEALEDESVRQSLIVFAAPQLFDEPVRFYSDVVDFKATKNPQIRVKKATTIIKRYILAESPLELCLPAPLRHKYERMLAIQDQENENRQGKKSRGFFGWLSSSSAASNASTPSNSATTVPTQSERNSTPSEQLTDIEVFQPVLKLVTFGIQADRKRWRGMITFLDGQGTTAVNLVGAVIEADDRNQKEENSFSEGDGIITTSVPKENPSQVSLS